MGKITAADMRRALWRHFAGRWAIVFEVQARPAPMDDEQIRRYRSGEIGREDLEKGRRIDALLVRRSRGVVTVPPPPPAAGTGAEPPPALFDVPTPPPGPVDPGDDGDIERLAIEIKVTRADFVQDVGNPDKQAPWRELAHRHAYAVPAGLVRPDEVPPGSGLIAVTFRPDGYTSTRFQRNAPRSVTATPLPTANVLDAFYRWSRAEALTLGVTGTVAGVDTEDVEALRARLKKVTHDLELANNAAERARDRAELWRKRFGHCDPLPCATCGLRLRPTRAGRSRWDGRSGYEWDHLTAEDHAGCLALRTAEAARKRGEHDRNIDWWFVDGPEPAEPVLETTT